MKDDPNLLEVGRKAIEDELVEWRDSGLSSLGRNNGFVIKSFKGESSSVIRFGAEIGLEIALTAIVEHLEKLEMNDE